MIPDEIEPLPQADGDSSVPNAPPAAAVAFELSQKDARAFALLTVAGFAAMMNPQSALPTLKIIEDSFNPVFTPDEFVAFVNGPLARLVDQAFGEGASELAIEDLVRIFTA